MPRGHSSDISPKSRRDTRAIEAAPSVRRDTRAAESSNMSRGHPSDLRPSGRRDTRAAKAAPHEASSDDEIPDPDVSKYIQRINERRERRRREHRDLSDLLDPEDPNFLDWQFELRQRRRAHLAFDPEFPEINDPDFLEKLDEWSQERARTRRHCREMREQDEYCMKALEKMSLRDNSTHNQAHGGLADRVESGYYRNPSDLGRSDRRDTHDRSGGRRDGRTTDRSTRVDERSNRTHAHECRPDGRRGAIDYGRAS